MADECLQWLGFREDHAVDRRIAINTPGQSLPEGLPDNTISNTKYTLYNFLPKNLWEQFGMAFNMYFLMIAFLQLWQTITPVNPITTWFPLLVIFGLSAAKEGIDDYQRAKADSRANSRQVSVLSAHGDGREEQVPASSLRCGDIVIVKEGQEFPADLVLLASARAGGLAYIQTANIDGETNLKKRTAASTTGELPLADLARVRGFVSCAAPNKEIYQFDSTLEIDGAEMEPLSTSQLLPQATVLKNTKWIAGVAVYTGNHTKVGMNKTTPRRKWTALDRLINRVTIGVFCCQLTFVIILGSAGIHFWRSKGKHTWYLGYQFGGEHWWNNIVIPLRFLLLSSMMIPISLKVTLDVIKLYFAMLINWDLQLYDDTDGRDEPAVARNTAISEDLGQVEYVLTDKTGTLTENLMLFRKFSVLDRLSGANTADRPAGAAAAAAAAANMANDSDAEDGGYKRSRSGSAQLLQFGQDNVDLHQDVILTGTLGEQRGDCGRDMDQSRPTTFLLRHMALCNTVVPSTKGNEVQFASSSPDEECLVQAAHHLGVSLVGREADGSLQLAISAPASPAEADRCALGAMEEDAKEGHGTVVGYKILATLGFTSTRKRMSVIVQESSSNKIYLLCKGADDVIFARMAEADAASSRVVKFRRVLDEYAQSGLRTLCFAWRPVSSEELAAWQAEHRQASLEIHNRDQALRDVYEKMEHSLLILGVTGIEDKLQPKVGETIATLRQAGIRVWMLTGDKFQTALEISRACKLVSPVDELFVIEGDDADTVGDSLQDAISSVLTPRAVADPPLAVCDFAIIIEGSTLGIALSHHEEAFAMLGTQARAVVCCRVSPAQKAVVVALVKQAGKVTLAIGDGGNDVSMIQEADVGVGISGREGLQAARAADYSFARFSFLARLCLVHGRYSYNRTAFISQYCFYKSLFICFIQLYFGFVSAFSGASFFDSFSLTAYNIFYTSVPVLFYSLDQDVQPQTLMAFPELYATSRTNSRFSVFTLCTWLGRALLHSLVVMLIIMGSTHGGGAYEAFGGHGQISTALCAYAGCVFVQATVVMLETTYFTWLNHLAVWGTLLVFFLVNFSLAAIKLLDLYNIIFVLMADGMFWLRILLIVGLCSLPTLAIRYWTERYHPTEWQLARMADIFRKNPSNPYFAANIRHLVRRGANGAAADHGTWLLNDVSASNLGDEHGSFGGARNGGGDGVQSRSYTQLSSSSHGDMEMQLSPNASSKVGDDL